MDRPPITAPARQPDPDQVFALDNIALDLPIAGIGSRALAAGIDYFALAWLMLFALAVTGGLLAFAEVGGMWILGVVLVVAFAVNWGYFVGLEIATGGRTLGKMAVQLRTVGSEGGTASTGSLVVRNLLRDIDLVVGLPLMVLDPRSRRLGDRLAGTLVVHERRPEPEVRLGRVPNGWGAEEVAVAESYLRRTGELEPHRSRHLARRLLALIGRSAPELAAEVAAYSDPELAVRRALAVEESEA